MPEHQKQTKNRRSFRYGPKPTREIVLDAVLEMGKPVTPTEVGNHIRARIPDFVLTNVGPDLSVLSVNCYSRGNHGVNKKPRQSVPANEYDQLVRKGKGQGVTFEKYDPAMHGIWALEEGEGGKMRPRMVAPPDAIDLEEARAHLTTPDEFISDEDARRWIMAAIVRREGQPQFRENMLGAYADTCAISGCAVKPLLEAAHIRPYLGAHSNHVTNGLLLRADLHKLFDLHMFRIDPETLTVHVCDELKETEYGRFDKQKLRLPASPEQAPSPASLRHHHDRCAWTLKEAGED